MSDEQLDSDCDKLLERLEGEKRLADGIEDLRYAALFARSIRAISALRAERSDLKAEVEELRATCSVVLVGLEWSGDGYTWNPTHSDYRERVVDSLQRGTRAHKAELAALRAERDRLAGEVEQVSIAAECLRQVWQCFDAAGISNGRSRQALWLESAMHLLKYDHRYSNIADTDAPAFEAIRSEAIHKVTANTLRQRDVELGLIERTAR